MSTTKNINGNYNLSTLLDPMANITLSTRTVFVNGNLFVGGNATYITKTELNVTDNIITVNAGGGGPGGVVLNTAGLEVDRKDTTGTGLANVAIVWNETNQRWMLTNDGATYANISTSAGSLYDDPTPTLSANLNVNGYSIFSSSSDYAKFDTNVTIKNTTVAPAIESGYTVLAAQTPSTGTSGLYVTNSDYTNEELLTKKRGIGYSIIFSS